MAGSGSPRWARPATALLVVWGGFICTLPPRAASSPDAVPSAPEAGVAAPLDPTPARFIQSTAVRAAAMPSVADSWSPSTVLRTSNGWYATPVHATLMPDGRVLFVGIARNADPPGTATQQRRIAWLMAVPAPGALMPAETTITELNEPFPAPVQTTGNGFISYDLICSGQTLTADGKVVTAGGTQATRVGGDPSLYVNGLTAETRFDGTAWVQYPGTMLAIGAAGTTAKWYPTVTRTPDSRMLITGGFEQVSPVPQPNAAIETLDPVTGARSLFSNRANTPTQIINRDYTHTFVLPYANASKDLLMFGEQSVPVEANLAQPGQFAILPTGRPGYTTAGLNWGTSSLMLPIRVQNGQWGYGNGSVLQAGGNMGTPWQRRADIFDPVSAAWKPTIDLSVMRHHPSTVGLPDGRVLLVNGHDKAGDARVQQAQYIDPANAFAVSLGSSTSGVVRGYHSVALLLPDGRVLVGGGRDQDTDASLEKPSFQIYTPDYLAKTRPVLASAPTQINYSSLFATSSTGPVPAEAVLVGLGSMTHSFDANQRTIQLPVGQVSTNPGGASLLIAGGPADSHVAPPGYYMLFLLDANRVPSVATIVHVG